MHYKSELGDACTACPAGRMPNAMHSACVACLVNGTVAVRAAESDTCSACQPGREPSSDLTRCGRCDFTEVSPRGLECYDCGANERHNMDVVRLVNTTGALALGPASGTACVCATNMYNRSLVPASSSGSASSQAVGLGRWECRDNGVVKHAMYVNCRRVFVTRLPHITRIIKSRPLISYQHYHMFPNVTVRSYLDALRVSDSVSQKTNGGGGETQAAARPAQHPRLNTRSAHSFNAIDRSTMGHAIAAVTARLKEQPVGRSWREGGLFQSAPAGCLRALRVVHGVRNVLQRPHDRGDKAPQGRTKPAAGPFQRAQWSLRRFTLITPHPEQGHSIPGDAIAAVSGFESSPEAMA